MKKSRAMYMKEFRKIPSLKFLFEISNTGIIRNIKSKHILKARLNTGYLEVAPVINGKQVFRKVHRLVAECWCNPPENWEELTVNHKDHNRLNNNASNLEWMSLEDNIKEAHNFGSYKHLKNRLDTSRKIYAIDFDMVFNNSFEAGSFIKSKYELKGSLATVQHNIRFYCRKNKFGYYTKWKFI